MDCETSLLSKVFPLPIKPVRYNVILAFYLLQAWLHAIGSRWLLIDDWSHGILCWIRRLLQISGALNTLH